MSYRKRSLSAIQAIIFDMDGVLIDSEPLHLMAYQRYLGSYGHAFEAKNNHEFLGRKDTECAHHLIERFKLNLSIPDFVRDKEEVLHGLFSEKLSLQPGVLKTLERARELKIPTAIASSATMPTIELVVDLMNLADYFQFLCSGDEVPNGKPAPDVFLLAAQRLGREPGECLVIEDTFNGVCAANAAGMMCIAIPCQSTRHQDFAHADMVLASMDEINLEELIAPKSLA